MRKRNQLLSVVLWGAAVIALAGAPARAQENLYDGQFTLAPNGDLDIVLKLTLPMEKYQGLRNSVSNLYLFMRDLASNRADAEVTQKKAEWDDSSRTVTFAIHMVGAARNMGNHWEFDVGKGARFSNLDEGKKTVFFNESGEGEMSFVKGTSRLQLPAETTQARYDVSRRIVTYVLPIPSSGSLRTPFLVTAALFVLVGLGVFGVSFRVGRKPTQLPSASG